MNKLHKLCNCFLKFKLLNHKLASKNVPKNDVMEYLYEKKYLHERSICMK